MNQSSTDFAALLHGHRRNIHENLQHCRCKGVHFPEGKCVDQASSEKKTLSRWPFAIKQQFHHNENITSILDIHSSGYLLPYHFIVLLNYMYVKILFDIFNHTSCTNEESMLACWHVQVVNETTYILLIMRYQSQDSTAST